MNIEAEDDVKPRTRKCHVKQVITNAGPLIPEIDPLKRYNNSLPGDKEMHTLQINWADGCVCFIPVRKGDFLLPGSKCEWGQVSGA